MKLGTQLIGAFVAVCAIGAVVSGIGIRNMGLLSAETETMYARDLTALSHVKEANINLLYVARDRRSAMLANTEAERDAFLGHADKALAEMRSRLDLAKPMFFTDKGKATYAAIDQAWSDYTRMGQDLQAKIHAGKLADANELTKLLFGDFATLANKIDDNMTTLAVLKEGNAKDAAENAAALYVQSRNWMLGLVAAALALGIATGVVLTRGLTRKLGAEPDETAALARRVAAGDLSVAIALRHGESDSLMAQLKAMQDNLARVVAEVRQNSESVATASAEIAQGNSDLSSRTEEQASALEETAASMEELGSAVKHNADNARQADQLAQGASTVAVKGGEVVAQVVQTMKGINDSSRRIADIIGVIDGIAFRTNILALNAAVEAARAGEQGRGFAVVASEVRSLAQRSAEAAREIKSLITASVERVEQGSTLVDQAGVTMTEVVAAIRRVTDIMGEISAASREQSAGVAQVGEAIVQMDQATQQNAALVEQSAAAAESLKQQAQALVQAVAVFRLDAGAPSAHAAAPAAAPHAAPVERRGPQRARNVVRPNFSAAAAPAETPRKTGTDDEWASF